MSDELIVNIAEGSEYNLPIKKVEIEPVKSTKEEDVAFSKTALKELITLGLTELNTKVFTPDDKLPLGKSDLIKSLVDAAKVLATLEKDEKKQDSKVVDKSSKTQNNIIVTSPADLIKQLDDKSKV